MKKIRIGIFKEVVICTVCKDWQLGKMTTQEAWRNLNEMIVQDEEEAAHWFYVAEKLSETEDEKA